MARNRICAINQCHNDTSMDEIVLHSFPTNRIKFNQWIHAIPPQYRSDAMMDGNVSKASNIRIFATIILQKTV